MNRDLTEARVRNVSARYKPTDDGTRAPSRPRPAPGDGSKLTLDWNLYAGGTTAKEGTHSYDTKGWFGEFHIWPPAIPAEGERRRTWGYALKWANTRGLSVSHTHSGLWHDIDVYRTPAIAKKAAREYIIEHLLPFAPR